MKHLGRGKVEVDTFVEEAREELENPRKQSWLYGEWNSKIDRRSRCKIDWMMMSSI